MEIYINYQCIGIFKIWTSWEGNVIHIWGWSNLIVTLSFKFKDPVYHARNFDLSIHVCMCVHRCTELWLWIY